MINIEDKANEKKVKSEKIDRIPLSKKASRIVDDTIKTMTDKHASVDINKKSFVNWLIEENFSALTPATEKKLFDKFHDEIKFLEKKLKTLKQKKKNGEEVSIAQVLKQAKPRFRKTEKTPKENNPKPPPTLNKEVKGA